MINNKIKHMTNFDDICLTYIESVKHPMGGHFFKLDGH